MKRFIVTGCNGYIGSHMCYELKKHYPKCHITGIDIVDKPKLHRLYDRYVQMDLCSGAWNFYDEKFDAVFHFAAFISVPESQENPYSYYYNNLVGSMATLDAAIDLGIKNFIFSSTCAVYGDIYKEAHELMGIRPHSVYAKTKAAFEEVLFAAQKEKKINAAVLRYFNAAGRNREADLYEEHDPETHLIPNLMKTTEPTIYGTGNDVRDYIHVIDLCQAHIKAYEYLENTSISFICNVGTGEGHTANEIVDIVSRVTGVKRNPKHVGERHGDVSYLVSDVKRMKKLLQFTPKYGIVDIIKSM